MEVVLGRCETTRSQQGVAGPNPVSPTQKALMISYSHQGFVVSDSKLFSHPYTASQSCPSGRPVGLGRDGSAVEESVAHEHPALPLKGAGVSEEQRSVDSVEAAVRDSFFEPRLYRGSRLRVGGEELILGPSLP